MKVLVTGSSGRIGLAVVEALLAKDHTVRGFDLRASGRSSSHYDEVTGSLDDVRAVENAVSQVDAVLHLGAFMSWAPQDKAKMFSANVEGTRLLAHAASAAGVRRFVFASSGEVYPENAPLSLPVTEDQPLNANSPYGLTKLLGEEIVRFHQRAGKMQTVILRFSHTQDASELLDENSFFSGPRFFLRPRIRQQENFGNHAVAEILRVLDTGEPAHILARNEHGRPYQMHITDTRDMVQGVLLALQHEDAAGQVFNLGATDPVDFEALLVHMSDITGLPIIIADLPGQGVYYQTSNEKIRRILGYQPVWTIERMVKEAGEARRRRRSS
uniref:NAD-dependent epimerase/dehydratase family protein n=1 Tax=Pararhizobium sp. IMCC3301 TaxID=3067904 RepID=UPI002740C1F9|nr:NAD(P)-dependent oxidoreductase [Pararhizobium sp. IMCC3301]